ncbi:MAG: phage tail protein [Deltaproteobacteria bacterium]|nr:MAG: phage tail protein [Deltaproteobacteria bacterium]
MAENLFAMLQKAQETASAADSKMFGVEVAIVTNVKDDDKLGRIKVCFPRLPGKPESDWVRVAQPAAGAGRGFYWLPHVNDEVLVAFERGEAHRPYVIGSLWNGKDKPIKGAYEDENTTIFIQTKSGHQIVLDDKSGQEKIVIADKSGNRTLTFDVKNKKFLVEAKEGDVEIHAEKKIILECEDLEIKTKKTGKIDIGSTFDLNVKDKANIKAGPQLNIKASRVNIN